MPYASVARDWRPFRSAAPDAPSAYARVAMTSPCMSTSWRLRPVNGVLLAEATASWPSMPCTYRVIRSGLEVLSLIQDAEHPQGFGMAGGQAVV